MFFYTLDLFLSEFDRISPEIAHAIRDMAEAIQSGDHEEAARRFFDLPNISIDFALAEHVRRLFVVPAEFPWDDVGSWDAMHRSFDGDHAGNVVRGRTVVIDSRNSIVVNEGMPMTIGVVGMEGVVVVATKDGILVCPVDQAQRVKEIVTQMKSHGH
jgi:mannose-1-phosphate guanylyltransferase